VINYKFPIFVHGDIRNVLYCIAPVNGKREPKKKWEHTRNLENRHNINAIYLEHKLTHPLTSESYQGLFLACFS
jgi:hypothetical protein